MSQLRWVYYWKATYKGQRDDAYERIKHLERLCRDAGVEGFEDELREEGEDDEDLYAWDIWKDKETEDKTHGIDLDGNVYDRYGDNLGKMLSLSEALFGVNIRCYSPKGSTTPLNIGDFIRVGLERKQITWKDIPEEYIFEYDLEHLAPKKESPTETDKVDGKS